MPNKRSLVCVGFICWLACISVASPATAQDINAIGPLIASGNHAAALAEAQKFEAAAKAQVGVNHPSYAYALSALASVYLAQEKYDEAEGLFRRALVIREQVQGDDHPDVAQALTHLSVVYTLQAKFGEAEVLLRRALAIQQRALGDNDITVATTLGFLALTCLAQGKDQEGYALRDRAKSIMDNAVPGRQRP